MKILWAPLVAALLLPCAIPAQTVTTTTTLASAAGRDDTIVYLATPGTLVNGNILYMDREAMSIKGTLGAGYLVERGRQSTSATAHAAGVAVLAGDRSIVLLADPAGACPATSSTATYVNPGNGRVWTCPSGSWIYTDKLSTASSSPGGLVAANNLSDLTNAAAARSNLGLGTAATQSTSAFTAAGGLAASNNLSDLANAGTARTNLGLGTAATQAASAFAPSGALAASSNLSDLASAPTARTNLGLGTAATQAATAFAPPLPLATYRAGLPLRTNSAAATQWGPIPDQLHIIGNNHVLQQSSPGTNGTDLASTTRVPVTTIGPISNIQLFFINSAGLSGTGEVAGTSFVIYKAAVEYGSVLIPITLSGAQVFTLDPATPGTLSDIVGIAIPAATTFYIRIYCRVPGPPTTLTATAAAGGSLAANTYFYKITSIDNNIESGPSAEFSGTTASSNLSLSLAWTAPANGAPSFYRIYRSTATGTETLVAQIVAPSTGYTDSGVSQVVSTATPPASKGLYFSARIPTGYSTQGPGNNADLTGSTGVISANVGPTNVFGAFPFFVMGDDHASNPIIGQGDSIEAGTGINEGTNLASGSRLSGNWFDAGIAGSYPSLNSSIGGAFASQWTTNAGGVGLRTRLAELNYGDIVISDLGHNDIYGSVTWQNTAIYMQNFAIAAKRRGQKFFLTTLTPTTTSTDDYLTVANQTVLSQESQRLGYNAWVRGGLQFSGGTPVASGGTASPYIDGYFDLAGPVEVNASNVVTPNGGFYLAPSAPVFTGLVLTGTPTLTSLAVASATFTASAMAGWVVKMTSGAANGQVAFVQTNSSTAMGLYAGSAGPTGAGINLTTVPAAGDTFNLYNQYSPDGIHPSFAAHTLLAAAFATWLAANLSTPF